MSKTTVSLNPISDWLVQLSITHVTPTCLKTPLIFPFPLCIFYNLRMLFILLLVVVILVHFYMILLLCIFFKTFCR